MTTDNLRYVVRYDSETGRWLVIDRYDIDAPLVARTDTKEQAEEIARNWNRG